MLICLVGEARAGKDTAGKILAQKYNLKTVALADAAKEIFCSRLNITREDLELNKKELRTDLINFCEQEKEKQGKNVWVNLVPKDDVIVTDIRYPEEYDYFNALGAHFIKVLRPQNYLMFYIKSKKNVFAVKNISNITKDSLSILEDNRSRRFDINYCFFPYLALRTKCGFSIKNTFENRLINFHNLAHFERTVWNYTGITNT